MNSAADIERIAREYTPLVKAAAAKYQGRGAEYEDLVQEGYMALVVLVPQCRDRQWLPLFLRNRVPYHVRDAAARLRGRTHDDGGEVLLEAIEETAGAEDEKYGEAELRETLRRTLTRNAGAHGRLHPGRNSARARHKPAGRSRATQKDKRQAETADKAGGVEQRKTELNERAVSRKSGDGPLALS